VTQSLRLAADDGERLSIFGLVAMIAAQRDLRGCADHRHRRAQLVRRIGRELALDAEGFGDRPRAQRREIDAASGREQQNDRDADEHRFLRFALFPPDVGQRACDHERQLTAGKGFRRRVHAPGSARGFDRAHAPRVGDSGVRGEIQPVPSLGERGAARVDNRNGAPRRRDEVARLLGSSLRVEVLRQLAADHVGERCRERIELAIDAPQADPPLLPQHVCGEQAQRDEQRQRVGQRQARAHRQQRHECASSLMS